MLRTLQVFLSPKTNADCAAFQTAAALFEGLKNEDAAAIRCLYAKTAGPIFKLGKAFHLPDEEIEELIGDCIALFLQKIRLGQYVFQGFGPATFVIEIAKNKARNFGRARKRNETIDLDPNDDRTEEPDLTDLKNTEKLEKLLSQLGENCQKIIRLKYLDELRDKEVIDQKLTQYTTVNALKTHRAGCMKKLVALGENFRS